MGSTDRSLKLGNSTAKPRTTIDVATAAYVMNLEMISC